MQAPFAQKLWKIPNHLGVTKHGVAFRDFPPPALRTLIQIGREDVKDLAPERYWESIEDHGDNPVVTVIGGDVVRDKIDNMSCVVYTLILPHQVDDSHYFVEIMDHLPDDLIARRNQVGDYTPPMLTIHCEVDQATVTLSSIARRNFLVQLESLKFKRQSIVNCTNPQVFISSSISHCLRIYSCRHTSTYHNALSTLFIVILRRGN